MPVLANRCQVSSRRWCDLRVFCIAPRKGEKTCPQVATDAEALLQMEVMPILLNTFQPAPFGGLIDPNTSIQISGRNTR